jgi:Na+-translocating ferredoxin:NAD+ oxidoreductase RnfG subunit
MNKFGIIAGVVPVIISILGFFLAIRTEIKKQTEAMLKRKIEEEKRHSRHEQRLAVLEQRTSNSESYVTKRLDDITRRLGELYEFILEYLKE